MSDLKIPEDDQIVRMRMARSKWWSALSLEGDPIRISNQFKAFEAGFRAGEADHLQQIEKLRAALRESRDLILWMIDQGYGPEHDQTCADFGIECECSQKPRFDRINQTGILIDAALAESEVPR